MTDGNKGLPLYYEGQNLADMENSLRDNYLKRSGWLESADKKIAVRDGQAIPWFTYGAISFLDRIISPDLRVFEYGGGQSTLYWARSVGEVDSIDHDDAFVDYVKQTLPANARIRLVAEGAGDLPPGVSLADIPVFQDPARTVKTYRSGQLNNAFRDYALDILTHKGKPFDIVVVDGMARSLATWAAIKSFEKNGFIIFDNADREEYRQAYDMLDSAGYRRIDFWGLGPINPYEWCTAIYYQPSHFQGIRWFGDGAETTASETTSRKDSESTAYPADELGIAVLGYNRPHHLQAVLESLRLQGKLSNVHVWIDGTQSRAEFRGANDTTLKLARNYSVKEIHAQRSHLGIEKMMLDCLGFMSSRYQRVLILEDDCFPTEGSVDRFEETLKSLASDDAVYSVYGCHFGTEPPDSPDFTRFQGWGWAAQSHQIQALLPALQRLFLMTEAEYLAYIRENLTDEIRSRLNRTPGRDVLNVLGSFFSWDSATAFLTAQRGLNHRRTQSVTIKNTGMTKGIGHFDPEKQSLRKPPFNMATIAEAWDHYDTTTIACSYDRESYGLDGLDKLIIQRLPSGLTGTFVEIGGYDGVTQSNSVLLEAAGWSGILIEANPGSYAKCRRARPRAIVENAACVSASFADAYTQITDVGLMSVTEQSTLAGDERLQWLARGEGFTGRKKQAIEVPTATLSQVLEKHHIKSVDLLLLDVEGAEIEVLSGIDFSIHAPTYIVAEDAYDDSVRSFLEHKGYKQQDVLLERKFTRDCFYVRND